MYHRIQANRRSGINKYYDEAGVLLKKDIFLKQIDFIVHNYKIISLSDANHAMASGINPGESTCVLTFDDGFAEHYDLVFPLLKKHKVSATFFVPTQHLTEKIPRWLDVIYYVLSRTKIKKVDLIIKNRVVGKFDVESIPEVKSLKNILRKMNREERKVVIKELADNLKVNIDNKKIIDKIYISKENIIEMSKGGMEFGAHTVSHPLLTAIGAKDAREEIGNSKRIILELSKQKKISFAYPFGGQDSYDNNIVLIVESLDFENACTSVSGINSSPEDRYHLRRIAAEKFIFSK